MLIGCSWNQQTSGSRLQTENGLKQHHGSKSGLLIDNGINRGTGYTDALGTKVNIRYIPITITNDSTIPIRFQIAFLNEYDHTGSYGNQNFKLIPLPKQWALDGMEITDSMMNALPKYIDKPLFNKILVPGEKCVFGIATLYSPTNYGPVPNALFSHRNRGRFRECDSLISQNESINHHLALELKLDFYRWSQPPESCTIIPCGQISYPGQ